MEIRYTYTYEDYQALCQAKDRNQPKYMIRKQFFWVILFANAGIGMWYILSDISAGNSIQLSGLVCLGLAILMLILRFALVPWNRRRFFKNQMIDGSDIVVNIDETGIATRNDKGEGRINWSGIHRIDNDPEYIIIWSSKVIGVSIPKSAINQEQMADLLRLVKNNVQIEKLT